MKSTIEEFYPLYRKVRRYLLQNINGIPEGERKKEFANYFMLQMLILWFIQKKMFFNEDNNYFITKFKELTTDPLYENKNYFEFIIYFLEKIDLYTDDKCFEDKITGKIVIPGPVIIFDFITDLKDLKEMSIPNKCFYIEDMTDKLKNSPSEKDIRDFSMFNFFENYVGNFNGFILGEIYENSITQTEKKNLGTYYTPETITSYICKTTLESYLFDKVNAKFNSKFETISSLINSHDPRVIRYLLVQLQTIKILDPAVGTAHLLESAIKSLMEAYKNVWRNSEKKLLVEVLEDENEENLSQILEISDENDFKCSVIQYILSKNIYGVDTNPDVLKIAKARLILLVIEHFDVLKNNPQNFPDIHLNLKEGNSLLGYIQFKGEKRSAKQQKLDTYITESNHVSNLKSFVIDPKLQKYLQEAAKALNIECSLVRELEELNPILIQEEIDELSIKKALRIQEKLLRILYSTMKTNSSKSLRDLLIKVTKLINAILDQKFSQEFSIDLTQLKKMKIFHWISEFPDIFLKEGGFHVIIANPPYLGESGSKELFRIYAKALSEYYEGKIDLWYLFLQRSLDLMLPNAFSSFITSNYWVTATGATRLRTRLLSNTFIVQYINFGENKVFSTAQGVHVNIITFKKARDANNNIECILFNTTYPQGTDLIEKLTEENTFMIKQKKLIFGNWDKYIHFFPKRIRVIIEQIIENSALLKTSGFYVKEGIVTGLNNITGRQIKKYRLPEEWTGLGVFILNKENLQDLDVIESFSQEEKIHLKNFYKNSDIFRYHTAVQTKKSILYLNRNTVNLDTLPKMKTHIQKFQEILQESLDNPPYINRPRSQDIFTSPKIVTPQRSLRNTFAYNSFDWYAAQDVYYILNDINNKEKLKSLLLILNSRLAYFWFYWMGKRKGKQLELFGEPISYFPIPTDLEVSPLFNEICDYLLFLHSSTYKEKRFQQMVAYFETQIVDSLVYEQYFKEIFQKTTIHQSNFSLVKILSELIKHIEFDEWEILHYKEKSGEGMSNDEKHQLEILENQNLEIIEERYSLLKDNKQIGVLIDQIKALDFVNTIEEGF